MACLVWRVSWCFPVQRRWLSAEQVCHQVPSNPAEPGRVTGMNKQLKNRRISPDQLSSRAFKPPCYALWGRQQLTPLQPTQRPTAVVSPSAPAAPGDASAVFVTKGELSDAPVCFLRHHRPLWASEIGSKRLADAFAVYPKSHTAAGPAPPWASLQDAALWVTFKTKTTLLCSRPALAQAGSPFGLASAGGSRELGGNVWGTQAGGSLCV